MPARRRDDGLWNGPWTNVINRFSTPTPYGAGDHHRFERRGRSRRRHTAPHRRRRARARTTMTAVGSGYVPRRTATKRRRAFIRQRDDRFITARASSVFFFRTGLSRRGFSNFDNIYLFVFFNVSHVWTIRVRRVNIIQKWISIESLMNTIYSETERRRSNKTRGLRTKRNFL